MKCWESLPTSNILFWPKFHYSVRSSWPWGRDEGTLKLGNSSRGNRNSERLTKAPKVTQDIGGHENKSPGPGPRLGCLPSQGKRGQGIPQLSLQYNLSYQSKQSMAEHSRAISE